MTQLLLKIVLRLLGCAIVTYLVWRGLGPVGLVFCAPLFGVALARPIVDLVAESAQMAQRVGLRDLHGRHFVYRGTPIDVVEDAQQYRWLRLADVRKIVTGLPVEPVLRSLLPDGLQPMGPPANVCIKAEALQQYLQKVTEPNSLRFRRWLEREVVMPAGKLRERK